MRPSAESLLDTIAALATPIGRSAIALVIGIQLGEPTTLHKLLKMHGLSVEQLVPYAPETLGTLSREERSILESRVHPPGK